MNIGRIRRRLSNGFRPFCLRTTDGREYSARHPELVLIGPRTMAVLDKDGEIVILDPLHIVALKDLPPQKSGPTRR